MTINTDRTVDYDMTIGIECHVQLATATKLFSAADNDARDKAPNSVVSAIDYGLPGMLPVLNKEAVRLAIKAGKALNAEVALESRFDRKHYFYPDLPKGYQTTQLYQPIIGAGVVHAPLETGGDVTVRIHHAHMEEDAGKLTHFAQYSLVDLNRAGTPLIEIVSEPDMHTPAEAKAYAAELHRLMIYAGVTHGDLYHGNMRFDVNISVAKKGASELGQRAEIKNLNSFRSIERAAEYEFRRQVEILTSGGVVTQETRGWSDTTQTTSSQRSKEDAQDYRYMPDADIPPILLTQEEVAAIHATVPKLPGAYRDSWKNLQLDSSVINTVLGAQPVAELLDTIHAQQDAETTKRIFNWFASSAADEIDLSKVSSGAVGSDRLVALSNMVGESKVSSTSAKEIFGALFDAALDGVMPEAIAAQRNLLQVSDEAAIAAIVDEVMADSASQQALADIKAGNDKAIGFLVGQIMKKSQGKANPALAQKLIRERLS